MKNLFLNTTLNSSDKAIIIVLALIVIALVLIIMYKIDSIPDEYKKNKRTKRKEFDEDLSEQIDDEDTAEDKVEELFNNGPIFREDEQFYKIPIDKDLIYENEIPNCENENLASFIDSIQNEVIDDGNDDHMLQQEDENKEKIPKPQKTPSEKGKSKTNTKETEKKAAVKSAKKDENKKKTTKKAEVKKTDTKK